MGKFRIFICLLYNKDVKIFSFKTLAFLILIASALVFYTTFQKQQNVQENLEDEKVLGDTNSTTINIEYKDRNYLVSWFEADPTKTFLLDNFNSKNAASKIYDSEGCVLAINAGFYSPENKPLGYFVTNYEVKYNFVKNKIMNGILSINSFDIPRITKDITSDSPRNAVQTGPILIENDFDIEANIEVDKYSRRMVAAVTGENRLYFLAIYGNQSAFDGPKIEDLAKILNIFEEKTQINIADAINLDGGKASYFNNGENTLTEISPIGALFCVK